VLRTLQAFAGAFAKATTENARAKEKKNAAAAKEAAAGQSDLSMIGE